MPPLGEIRRTASKRRRAAREELDMSQTTVKVRNNGPLRIEGDFVVLDAEGRPFGLAGRTNVALCRCGQSESKPFCDGAHGKAGFSSECPARELPPPVPKA